MTGSDIPVPRLSNRISPRERSEMVEELCEAREPPLQLHVGNEARNEHEVKWPIANHLVGNVDIAAKGVTRSGPTAIFSPARGAPCSDNRVKCYAP